MTHEDTWERMRHRRIAMRARALRAHGAPTPRLVAVRHSDWWRSGARPRTSRIVRVSYAEEPLVAHDLRAMDCPEGWFDITVIRPSWRGERRRRRPFPIHEQVPAREAMETVAKNSRFARHGNNVWVLL